MNAARFQKIKDIFAEAEEVSPDKRISFLREKCGADEDLFAEINSLLAAHDEAENLIEKNAFDYNSVTKTKSNTYNGRIFGHYKIIREIGHGGMGAVFLAERNDGEFDQQVALKIVRQTIVSAELERHFRRERQILASLNHPNIAKLFDGGVSENGEPFLAMEYIEGKTLLDFAADLATEEKLKLFLKVCNAVAYAHQNLVVHHDIKPSNIIVTKDGEPKLLDFGLAKMSEPSALADDLTFTNSSIKEKPPATADGSDLNQTVFRALTPAYASPEQLRGKSVTTVSDVFSLGVVFYELLSGDKPFHFEGKSLEEIIQTITHDEAIPPSAVSDSKFQNSNPKLKGDLDNIALKALQKEPERRFRSVEEFANDIERHLKGLPILARPATFAYRASKFFRRNKIAVSATAFVIFALFSGLTIALWQANVARNERDRAEKRFNDVRKLSNSLLFEITPKIERLQGSTEARELLVKRALEYLDSLSFESQTDAELQSELASAYEKIAELQGNPYKPNLNDAAGAIENYQKAQNIRFNLPQTFENQRLLAENYRRFSETVYTQNDVKSSLDASVAALEIYQKLIVGNPQFIALQIARIDTQMEYGATFSVNNQFGKAIPIFQKTIAELALLDQNNREIQRLSALTLAQLSNAFSWDGKQAEAETEMTKAVQIIENLIEKNPNDNIIRRTAFRIYALASSIYEEIKNDISLKYAEKFLQIAIRAVETDSADLHAKSNLARAFSRVGICFVNVGRNRDAILNLEKAENLLRELIVQEPKNLSYKKDLARLYIRFGDAQSLDKNYRTAVESYQKSADFYQNITDSDEKDTQVRRDMAQSVKNVAETFLKLNEIEKAKQNYQKAAEILKNLIERNALGEFDRKMFEDVQKALQKL